MSRVSLTNTILKYLPTNKKRLISALMHRTALGRVIDESFNLEDDDASDIKLDNELFSATNVDDALTELKVNQGTGFGGLTIQKVGNTLEITGGQPNQRLAIRTHLEFEYGDYDGWASASEQYKVFIGGIELGEISDSDSTDHTRCSYFGNKYFQITPRGWSGDAFVYDSEYVTENNLRVAAEVAKHTDPHFWYTDIIDGATSSANANGGMWCVSNPTVQYITLDSSGEYTVTDDITYSPSIRGGDEFKIKYRISIIGVEYQDVGFQDQSIYAASWVVPSNQDSQP